jgi:hypothetical protein
VGAGNNKSRRVPHSGSTGNAPPIRLPESSTASSTARGDPTAAGLLAGGTVGMLGIDLATRRRNRVNGSVVANGSSLRHPGRPKPWTTSMRLQSLR